MCAVAYGSRIKSRSKPVLPVLLAGMGAGSEEPALSIFAPFSVWPGYIAFLFGIIAEFFCQTFVAVSIIGHMERAVFRIIDANFNRGREAGRVIEEFCRFSLNSTALTARAKELRHRLCKAVSRLDAQMLIAARDSNDDVGFGVQVAGQMKRANLHDCFVAAAKRLTEALRTLAEVTQTIDPSAAQVFENLRFAAYTLEKDIFSFSITAEKLASVRLYVLLTAGPDSPNSQILDTAAACIEGGADCLQLRAKGLSDRRTLALADEIVGLCRDGGVISIINDRVDIAVAAGADGVHLGQDDMPLAQSRKLQLKPMIFGLSTHSTEQLKEAIGRGADYVSLGPVFPTGTKPKASPVGLEYVSRATELLTDTGIGHVAIGGITLENVSQVLKAGAKTIALCSAVANSSDQKEMCEKLKDKITSS
jgi:thiamine-phosphate pyrophosphorylase